MLHRSALVSEKVVLRIGGIEVECSAADLPSVLAAAARGGEVKAVAAAPEPTFAELWAAYKGYGETSIKSWPSNQRCHEKNHLAFWGALRWDECTVPKLDAYRKELAKKENQRGEGYEVGSRNAHTRTLISCLNWAVKRLMIPHNPLKGAGYEPETPTRDFHATEEEFAQFLEHAHPLLKLMSILSFETGMRRNEVRTLEEKAVDLVRLTITLRHTKNGEQRTVPLTDAAADAVKRALAARLVRSRYVFPNPNPDAKGAPIPETTLQYWMQKARERSGVTGPEGKPLWFHTWRHSFGSLNAMAGMPIPMLMDVAGWKSPKVARLYMNMSKHHIENARKFMNKRGLGVTHFQLIAEATPLKK